MKKNCIIIFLIIFFNIFIALRAFGGGLVYEEVDLPPKDTKPDYVQVIVVCVALVVVATIVKSEMNKSKNKKNKLSEQSQNREGPLIQKKDSLKNISPDFYTQPDISFPTIKRREYVISLSKVGIKF